MSITNKIDCLREFAGRFDDVVVENFDWRRLVEKYSSPETVFYFDPPYLGAEEYYLVDDIEHAEFVEVLTEIEGRWLCSYQDLPEGMDEFRVVGRDDRDYINNGTSGSTTKVREHLTMNFNPSSMEAV